MLPPRPALKAAAIALAPVIVITAVLGLQAPPTPAEPRIALRHAVATAVSCGVALGIALAFQIDHGYWLVVTLALVLRPVRHETVPTARARVTGPLVGVVISVALRPAPVGAHRDRCPGRCLARRPAVSGRCAGGSWWWGIVAGRVLSGSVVGVEIGEQLPKPIVVRAQLEDHGDAYQIEAALQQHLDLGQPLDVVLAVEAGYGPRGGW